ncbi:MAG: HAD family hydrolase, partial [Chloroflexi bacterium]|nr:HAD family hydrolase [Chloroflexota bacterium]
MHAVTLDLWRTLIDESPASGTGTSRLDARVDGLMRTLADAGLAFQRSRIEDAMARSRESFDRDHDRGTDVTFEGRVLQLLDFIETGLSRRLPADAMADAIHAVDAPFLDHPPLPVASAGEVLETIARMNVRMALISNTGFTSAAVYRGWLSQLGWLRWLSVTTFSNEAAVAKPTPEIFRRTLAALAVEPRRAMHVGDSPLHDVAGAKQAGM